MGDQGTSGPTHTPGTRQGEEIKNRDGKEAGRQEEGATGAGRPAGSSTARDSTAINPESVESETDGQTMPPA